MKIAIYGSGGVGGYFGGKLAQAGEHVTFLARGPHLCALHSAGLRVHSVTGDFTIHPAHATDDPAAIGPCDLILVAVKGWQLPAILPGLRHLVADQTTIVPLLNGVEAAHQLAQTFGPRAVGGTCKIVSALAAPGHVHHLAAQPELRVGQLAGSTLSDHHTHQLDQLCAAFTRVGVDARRVDDIDRLLWEKLIFIAAYGGLGALCRAPVGALRAPPTRHLLERALLEGEAVARAHNIDVAAEIVPRSLAYLDALAPDATTSLQRDILAGRPSELDDWSGALLRYAAAAGLEAPLHQLIHAALTPQETAARRQLLAAQA
jgi:2-dehydropantoate 2-reductase